MTDEPTPADVAAMLEHMEAARNIAARVREADWNDSEGIVILSLAIGCYMADDPNVNVCDPEDEKAFNTIVNSIPRGVALAFYHHRKSLLTRTTRSNPDGTK